MSLTYAEIMTDRPAEEEAISFKEIFQKFWNGTGAKHTRRPIEKPRRYPVGQNKPPIYKKIRLINREGDITASMYQLVCPICNNTVSRRNEYCSECGNKLKVEAEL